jgi:cytochrome c oxidase assembly protein subunit 15
MGCGNHWPKCNGSWIPPFNEPTVMIEYTHRLLAALVILSISWLVFAAWRTRAEPAVGGPGGVLPAATTALVLVVAVALLGMVTVKAGNSTWATVAHWTVAMTLLAAVITTAVRAGALGGSAAGAEEGTARTVRSLGVAAALAFVAVVLGALVAKTPGAAVACPSFPLCGATPSDIPASASHLQLTHRIIAYLLFFHVIGTSIAISRRPGESAAAKTAARTAGGLIVLQIGLGAAMVMSALPAALRSMHEAVGAGVWLTLFLAASLAKVASGKSELGAT